MSGSLECFWLYFEWDSFYFFNYVKTELENFPTPVLGAVQVRKGFYEILLIVL